MARRKNRELWEAFVDLLYLTSVLLFIKVLDYTKSLKWSFIAVAVWLVIVFWAIQLIKSIIRDWKRNKLLASGIDVVDNMGGKEFERFILAHFEKQGYSGTLTPDTADFGADLVLEKEGRKIVVQAKRWKRVVGIESVQQVVGAIKYYNADKGMVITNSSFTENAYELANSNGIELWDRKKLIEVMEKSGGRQVASSVTSEQMATEVAATSEGLCPRCGNTLVLRNGKRGRFWGCSGFPKCRFTKDI